MNSKPATVLNQGTPIISFCTDIKESVHAIEIDGEKAFNQQCYYIDNVADFYIKQLGSNETDVFRTNLWVPGDALWGVANSQSGGTLKDSIIATFSRIIASIAYGLSVTNTWSNQQQIPPLSIRGAAFYGQIFRKLLNGSYPLYNGRCLNVCGRIQEKVSPNSIVIGFIIRPGEDAANHHLDFCHIELPEIEFDSMEDHIRKMLQQASITDCGCRIKFNTVRTEENRLLLHFATYPTKELKGLEDTVIILTHVEFQVDKASRIFRVESQDQGPCYRKEYPINSFESISLADLIVDDKLDYLKQIYRDDNHLTFTYDPAERNFGLVFQGKRISPRVIAGKELVKKSVIDFARDKYCILPVYKTELAPARDKAVLIFVKNTADEQAIIFAEIPEYVIYNIKNYNTYYDMADFCIKLKLGTKAGKLIIRYKGGSSDEQSQE